MIFKAYTALLLTISSPLSYAQPDTPAELTYTKLVPERGSFNARFGVSVAAQSDFIAVGACGPSSGALYLFHTKDGSLAEILRPDGLSPVGQFGVSVIPRGRGFFVGAFTDHVAAHSSGSVFAVAPSSNTNHKFFPKDGAQFDECGLSIAASDDLLIVGAHRNRHRRPARSKGLSLRRKLVRTHRHDRGTRPKYVALLRILTRHRQKHARSRRAGRQRERRERRGCVSLSSRQHRPRYQGTSPGWRRG